MFIDPSPFGDEDCVIWLKVCFVKFAFLCWGSCISVLHFIVIHPIDPRPTSWFSFTNICQHIWLRTKTTQFWSEHILYWLFQQENSCTVCPWMHTFKQHFWNNPTSYNSLKMFSLCSLLDSQCPLVNTHFACTLDEDICLCLVSLLIGKSLIVASQAHTQNQGLVCTMWAEGSLGSTKKRGCRRILCSLSTGVTPEIYKLKSF